MLLTNRNKLESHLDLNQGLAVTRGRSEEAQASRRDQSCSRTMSHLHLEALHDSEVLRHFQVAGLCDIVIHWHRMSQHVPDLNHASHNMTSCLIYG